MGQDHLDVLYSRGEVQPDDLENLTEIYTVNVDVDRLNESRLNKIDEQEYTYVRHEEGAKGSIDSLGRSILAPKVLKLRRGALVMAIKNSPNRDYVNGSIGTVVGFSPYSDKPIIRFRNGKEVAMGQEEWNLSDGEEVRATISQIPLRLAWAITVHKSQGMTLDSARMNLSRAFVEGMGYVALSRVKNVNSLYLTGLNDMALRVSEEARLIDFYLREESGKNAEQFKNLLK